jgi:hypothetical protein
MEVIKSLSKVFIKARWRGGGTVILGLDEDSSPAVVTETAG